MCLDVSLEITSVCAGMFTLVATERPFSRMCQEVSFEVTSISAGKVALFATEEFFSWMYQHVSFQVTIICGGIIALIATERLVSGMYQHVSLQVTIMCAGIVALVAIKRFPGAMHQHVTFQGARNFTCKVALAATVKLLCIIHWTLKIFSHIDFEQSPGLLLYQLNDSPWKIGELLNRNHLIKIKYLPQKWKWSKNLIFGICLTNTGLFYIN